MVLRSDGRLLYASRAPIPSNKKNKFEKGWRQILVYAFPKKALKFFLSIKKKTELEKIEDIEILRFLELGFEVRTIKMSNMSLAIDTPEDVILVKKMISKFESSENFFLRVQVFQKLLIMGSIFLIVGRKPIFLTNIFKPMQDQWQCFAEFYVQNRHIIISCLFY